MNNKYSEAWDKKLKELLKTEDFKNINHYNADLWGFIIWITNHPYASFTYRGLRPSRFTIMEAKKKLDRDIVKQITNE